MSEANKNRFFNYLLVVLFFFCVFHFCIHFYFVNQLNKKDYVFNAGEVDSPCSVSIAPRGGVSDSWDLRDVKVFGKNCTLTGTTFDATIFNFSPSIISQWSLKINISQDCYLNKAWCGTMEIHQFEDGTENVQTLDLRNYSADDIKLNYTFVAQDLLVPLKEGDFIIYHPDLSVNEYPVEAFVEEPGKVVVGFIFYFDKFSQFEINDYSTGYKLKKGYFQGREPKIFLGFLSLWFILLVIRITSVIVYKRAEADAEKRMMESYNHALNAEVKQKTQHIATIQQKVVFSLANLVENRDSNTGGHVKRTSDVVRILVEEINKQFPEKLSEEFASDIVRAASTHDLGKICIDNAILCKPARLTPEEYEIMKTHSSKSGEFVKIILEGVEEEHFVNTAFNVARYHHERWDGKGYPEGLCAEQIPLEARIMAVADVYDALVSSRCYKEALSFEKAYEIMCEGMGTQFDPGLKQIFTGCCSQLEEYYSDGN